jgi:hypothetical protein
MNRAEIEKGNYLGGVPHSSCDHCGAVTLKAEDQLSAAIVTMEMVQIPFLSDGYVFDGQGVAAILETAIGPLRKMRCEL